MLKNMSAEVRKYGGVTYDLLFEMHRRVGFSPTRRRKLNHNTYSELMTETSSECMETTESYNVHADFMERLFTEPCGGDLTPDDMCDCLVFSVRLHGHPIVKVSKTGMALYLATLSYWNTVTTRDRVNEMLAYTGYSVHSKNNNVRLRTSEGWVYTETSTMTRGRASSRLYQLVGHGQNAYLLPKNKSGQSLCLISTGSAHLDLGETTHEHQTTLWKGTTHA